MSTDTAQPTVPPAQEIRGEFGPMPVPLYRTIAQLLMARENCRRSNNGEWLERHTDTLRRIAKDCLPSGSGIDSGTTIDLDKSTADRIVLQTSFHHMNDGGMYDGWTEHTITVRPSLAFGCELTISGRDRNEIKDYLGELYTCVLSDVR